MKVKKSNIFGNVDCELMKPLVKNNYFVFGESKIFLLFINNELKIFHKY